MSNLTDEMTQLRARLDRAAEDRQRFLARLATGEQERQARAGRARAERTEAIAQTAADVRAKLASFRSELTSATQDARVRRRERLAQISARVAALQDDVHELRTRNLLDLEGARAAWQGASAPAPAPRTQPTQRPSGGAPTTATTAHDDLTSIQGIGPGIQERLNRAGIHTFAELAAAAPERVLEALGELKRLASVESWVAEALTRTEATR
jgi:predicted flap endonuclease-1-like 5' DNA nuclease